MRRSTGRPNATSHPRSLSRLTLSVRPRKTFDKVGLVDSTNLGGLNLAEFMICYGPRNHGHEDRARMSLRIARTSRCLCGKHYHAAGTA